MFSTWQKYSKIYCDTTVATAAQRDWLPLTMLTELRKSVHITVHDAEFYRSISSILYTKLR